MEEPLPAMDVEPNASKAGFAIDPELGPQTQKSPERSSAKRKVESDTLEETPNSYSNSKRLRESSDMQYSPASVLQNPDSSMMDNSAAEDSLLDADKDARRCRISRTS